MATTKTANKPAIKSNTTATVKHTVTPAAKPVVAAETVVPVVTNDVPAMPVTLADQIAAIDKQIADPALAAVAVYLQKARANVIRSHIRELGVQLRAARLLLKS